MTFPYGLLSYGDRFANWAKKVGHKKHNFSLKRMPSKPKPFSWMEYLFSEAVMLLYFTISWSSDKQEIIY